MYVWECELNELDAGTGQGRHFLFVLLAIYIARFHFSLRALVVDCLDLTTFFLALTVSEVL
jgi:hypothetical protein